MTKLDDAIAAAEHLLSKLQQPGLDQASPASKRSVQQQQPSKGTGLPASKSAGAAATPTTRHETFSKAQLQVAHVLEVDADSIASDKLFKCRIEVANGEQRTVVAGLKRHVPKAELLGSLAVAILNLKPAKLAGVTSEAMLLAAEAEDAGCPDGRRVCLLVPSEGSAPGDTVHLECEAAAAQFPKALKGSQWAALGADLQVLKGRATYQGTPLVSRAGPITLPPGMPDNAKIK